MSSKKRRTSTHGAGGTVMCDAEPEPQPECCVCLESTGVLQSVCLHMVCFSCFIRMHEMQKPGAVVACPLHPRGGSLFLPKMKQKFADGFVIPRAFVGRVVSSYNRLLNSYMVLTWLRRLCSCAISISGCGWPGGNDVFVQLRALDNRLAANLQKLNHGLGYHRMLAIFVCQWAAAESRDSAAWVANALSAVYSPPLDAKPWFVHCGLSESVLIGGQDEPFHISHALGFMCRLTYAGWRDGVPPGPFDPSADGGSIVSVSLFGAGPMREACEAAELVVGHRPTFERLAEWSCGHLRGSKTVPRYITGRGVRPLSTMSPIAIDTPRGARELHTRAPVNVRLLHWFEEAALRGTSAEAAVPMHFVHHSAELCLGDHPRPPWDSDDDNDDHDAGSGSEFTDSGPSPSSGGDDFQLDEFTESSESETGGE